MNDTTGILNSRNENDINNTQQQTTTTNNITNIEQEYSFTPEVQKVKEEALSQVLAGTPQIPTLKHPTTPINVDKPEITSSFTTRDQVMSQLNLMDEEGNYTDTYTNYVNQGGLPLPGYEYAHQEILNQERYDAIFKQVEEGTMSYDTALMEAYGRDILAASFEIDVSSVAWWTNKYLNKDYSNPFDNKYLMAQVKDAAQSFHESRLASQYAKTNLKDTQLGLFVGQDLEMEQARTLFPELDKLSEELDDTQFLRALHNGQIAAQARITQDESGTYYYLHTDGEVYVLDGQGGENHGTLKLDKDGNFQGIDLNNSGLVSFERSVWTGFTGVFTGIVDLALIATDLICPFDMWDDNADNDGLFSTANAFDAWMRDNAAGIVDNGYVDLDSSKLSGQDLANLGGSIIGTIAGTMLLAGIVGGAGDAGTAASTASKGSGLIGWGDDLIRTGHTVSGKAVKGAGTILKWQTGNIGTNKGGYGHVIAFSKEGWKDVGLQWANGTNLQVWGRRLGASSVANAKNALNDYRYNMLAADLYDESATQGEIAARTMGTFLLNTAIDTFISGGMDDNQVQAYTGSDFLGMNSKDLADASSTLHNYLLKNTSDQALDAIEKNTSGAFKDLMKSRALTIGVNSGMDFVGNMLTGAISSANNLNAEGQFEDFLPTVGQNLINPTLLAQSTVNTLWYSTRGQIKDWNAGMDSIGSAHKNLIATLDGELTKYKNDPEKAAVIAKVKAEYIKDVQSDSNKETYYEGRILKAMDNLSKNLSKEGEVPEIIVKAITKAANPKLHSYYKNIYDQAQIIYDYQRARQTFILNPAENKYKFFKMFEPLRKVKQWATGEAGSKATIESLDINQAKWANYFSNMFDGLIALDAIEVSKKVNDIIDSKKPGLRYKKLECTTGVDIKKNNEKLYEALKAKDPQAANKYYYVLPNNEATTEAGAAAKNALDTCVALGYIRPSDVEGQYIYEVQPVFTPVDYVNTSIMTDTIYNSVVALHAVETPQERVEILNDLADVMFDSKASAVHVSAVLSKMIDSLVQKQEGKNDSAGGVSIKKPLTTGQATEIFKELQSKGKIVHVSGKNGKDLKAADSYNFLTTSADILFKVQKDKADQIDLSDIEVQKALKAMADDNTISQEAYKKITKIYEENPELFLDGNRLSKSKYIQNCILGSFSERVPGEKVKLDEKDIINKINLYLTTQGIPDGTIDKRTTFYKDIVKFAKEYDDLVSGQKSVKMEDNIIYVDLSKFNGNGTAKCIEKIIREGITNYKYLENADAFKEFESDMTKELNNMNKWLINNGTVLRFNLNSDKGTEAFKNFMLDFNYEIKASGVDAIKEEVGLIKGLTSHYGTTAVLNIDKMQNIESLQKEIFDNGMIELVNGERIAVKALGSKDMSGARLTQPDLINAILNNIEVHNIDAKLDLINVPKLALLPYTKDGGKGYWEPMSIAVLGEEESPGKVAGKQSKTLGKTINRIMKRTSGEATTIDADLENYFILDIIAKTLSDTSSKGSTNNIPITKEEYDELTKAGIIGEGKIWKVSRNHKTLQLNITDYNTIVNKILDKNFNVFELLPMQFIKNEESTQGITDLFATHTTMGAKGKLPGTLRETGLRFLSQRLPWDNSDNSRYASFINNLIEQRKKGLNYNPIKDAGFEVRTIDPNKSDYSLDEWYGVLTTSKNPYDILTKRYIDTYRESVKATGKDNNNETLLTANPYTRKVLIDTVLGGKLDLADLTSKLRTAMTNYLPAGVRKYQFNDSYDTVGAVTPRVSQLDDGTVLVGGSRVAEALGGYRNIIVNDGDIEWITQDIAQKAYDLVSDIIENEENIYRNSYFSNYQVVTTEDSDALKIFKGAAANDGYIPIQDVDEIANIIAENYRNVADGIDTDFKIKDSIRPTLERLYGKAYEKAADAIFKQAKRNLSLATSRKEVMKKHFVNPSSPSIQQDYKSAIGFEPTKDAEGNYKTITDSNAKTMMEFLQNRIDNELNDPRANYHKMLEESDGLLYNEITEAINQNTLKDRMLYTSAPYNSETQNLSFRHNSLGLMATSINTFDELKAQFPEGNDEELMKLATTLVNLNVGVDYAGERAQFIVVDQKGNLTSKGEDLLDKYASANMHDLLFNIHKSKDELKGFTIIHATKQDLSNTGALKLSYNKLDSENSFNKLVQNLFENFLLDNAYYLQKDLNNKDDAVTFANKILDSVVSAKELQTLLDNIPSHSMSQLSLAKKQYTEFQKRTGYKNISKVEFMSLTKTITAIDANQISDEAVKNLLDIRDSSYDDNIGGLRGVIDLIMGGNPDFYSQDKKRIINQLREMLTPTIEEGAKRSKEQQVTDFILTELTERGDSPILRYLTTGDSLLTMKQESETGIIKDAFAINLDEGDTYNTMSSHIMRDVVRSLVDNDPTIRIPYKTIVSLDTETGLKLSNLENNQGVFEVGLSIKTLTETGWTEKHYDIYLDYSGKKNITPQEITEYVNKWIKENVPEGHSFLQKEGYKKSLENFKNISSLINKDENVLFMNREAFKEFISQYLGNESIILGYNSSKADIPWLKASGLLTDEMLKNTTHVDVKVLGDTSQILNMKNKASQEHRALEMRVQNTEAHSGINDAKVTMELFTKIAASTYNIAGIKHYAYNSIKQRLDASGLKVSDETLNKILQDIDAKVTKAQESIKDLDTYFDKDTGIDPHKVAAATELFEFAINRRVANMSLAIRQQEFKEEVLGELATKALERGDYHKIQKAWAFLESKEVDLQDFMKAINTEMKLNDDFMTMNNLIEVISDDAHIYRILERLDMDTKEYETFEDTKHRIFKDDPSKDSRLDLEEFQKYRAINDMKPLVEGLKGIVSEMNLTNDLESQELINDLATLYDFREDLDISEVTKPNVEMLDTKISKLLNERLKNHYGDVDAIISFQQRGIYQLVGSQPVGQKIHDALSGQDITVDSSMIVLSRGMFERLVKENLDVYKKNMLPTSKELYSQLLIHPADANNKILPRRIVVNEKLPGFYMRVPETVIEVLGARDFDGDHLVLLEPRAHTQEVLKIYSNNMFKIHDVQERALDFLRKQVGNTKEYDDTTFIFSSIGKDQEIRNICNDADRFLSKHKYDESIDSKEWKALEDSFVNRVQKIISEEELDVDIDAIKKELWLVEFKGYEKTGSLIPIRYINNPAIQATGKALTHSGEERRRAEGYNLVDKYNYEFIDQTTGMTEKAAIKLMKNIGVENPWTDLLASGIYGSHTVYKYFSNLTADQAEQFCKDFKKNVIETIDTVGLSNKFITKELLDDPLKQLQTHIENGEHVKAFQIYTDILQKIEEAHRIALNEDTSLKDALVSDVMQKQYKDMEERVNIIKKNIELYNELKRNEIYFPSDSLYGKVSGYTLNETINQMISDREASFDNNVFDKATETKAFVITGYGSAKELLTKKLTPEESRALKKYSKTYFQTQLNFLNEVLEQKKRLLKTGMSQNPETPDLNYHLNDDISKLPLKMAIEETKHGLEVDIENISSILRKRGLKQEDLDIFFSEHPELVKRFEEDTPIGIAEDSILVNNNKAKERKLVGYTSIAYTVPEGYSPLKDIKVGQFLKRGTKLTNGADPLKLKSDAYIASVKGKSIRVIQISKLDNRFKAVTDFGGKATVDGSYSTDSDIDILVTKPSFNKILGGYQYNLDKVKQETRIIYDENKNPILVKGYVVDKVKPMITENTTDWTGNKDRKIDALHIMSDVNTINGLLEGFAKYDNETGELYTDVEALAELQNSVYKTYNDVQVHNGLATYNKMKFLYMFERLTESEVQEAFNSDLPKAEILEILISSPALASDTLTSYAYTLGEMHRDKIDNKLGEKLFSKDLVSLIGQYMPTKMVDFDPSKTTGKGSYVTTGSIREDGTSTKQFTPGKREHMDIDDINSMKDFRNLEDYYMSAFKLLEYLTDTPNIIDSFKAKELIGKGKLPYGRFIAGTANPENGFRHANINLTVGYDTATKVLKGISDSAKTAITTTQSDVVGVNPVMIPKMTLPTVSSRGYRELQGLSKEAVNLITDRDSNLIVSNVPKIANMLYQLEEVKDTDSIKDKKTYLNYGKKEFRIYDNHIALSFDDKGNPTAKFSKHIPMTGTLDKLKEEIKGSTYNYAFYNSINSDDSEYLDASSIKKNIKKDANKNAKKAQAKKELEASWKHLQKDLYNEETGEVKTNINPADYKTDSVLEPTKVLSGGENLTFEKSVWGRQGIKEDSVLGVALSTALKNRQSAALFYQQDALQSLRTLKEVMTSRMSEKEIKEYTVLHALYTTYKETGDMDELNEAIKYHRIDTIAKENKTTAIQYITDRLNELNYWYPEVESSYKQHVENLKTLNTQVAEITNEPFNKCLLAELAPYKSTSKEYNKAKAVAAIKTLMGIQKYNPINNKNKEAATLEFDLWNSSETIIKELSDLYSLKVIKNTLEQQNLLSNTSLLDDVSTMLDEALKGEQDGTLAQSEENRTIHRHVINTIYDLTNIDIPPSLKRLSVQGYKDMYDKIDGNLQAIKAEFYNTHGYTDIKTYTDFDNLSRRANINAEIKDSAKAIANFYYAKMLCGQSLIQSSPKFANDLGEKIQNLTREGYCLVNEFGQKYIRGGLINPVSNASTRYLLDNIEVQYNSYSESMWNQFVLEKIISGEIYLMRRDIADTFDEKIYTQKIPNGVVKVFKEVSKWSAALQMALPSKMINRLISFTGFDYSMGFMYDPKVLKYIGLARRELLAAFQSNGNSMSDELREYMIREGQPIGLSGKDPVTFSEDISAPDKVMKVLNTLTDPLEFQNHLGRYAIYLTAKEGFDNGKPNYGPAYFAKEGIDALERNEDKAMFVMDYILGSPGGFPELAKKTSGLMLYATFPMNFARTLGAYGMSLGKLFKEGITETNRNDWWNASLRPSLGLAGITGLSMALTALICNLFGIEDEEKEKMVKSLQTIDIVGTVIGGTPTLSSSSMNPMDSINSMFIEPFTNTYNETALEKIFGFVNTNVISHLNPALKVPLEVGTGYDFYGSSLMTTKYSYNKIENGLRKALGFVVGSSTANSIVDTYKIDSYEDDTTFIETLGKGITRGISASLGNQKTYKKDTTNYYNNITAVNNFRYKVSDYYSSDVEDFINIESMERMRNYSSEYGKFNQDDYKRISNLLKKMIKAKEEPSTVYALIVEEYNSGVSEATLKTVLNNNSLVRKLEQLGPENKEAFLRTLSSKEYANLVKAVRYENDMYPMLQKFFPAGSTTNYRKYLNYRKPYYKTSYGSSGSYTPYPTKRYPDYLTPRYTGYSKKYNSYNPYVNTKRVDVNVSPQMGIWENDYNAIPDMERNEWYLDNPFYNNLSEYEKRQKGGN